MYSLGLDIHQVLMMDGPEDFVIRWRWWSRGGFRNVRHGDSSIKFFLHLISGAGRRFFLSSSRAIRGINDKQPIGSVLRVDSVPARQNNISVDAVLDHWMELSIVPLVDEVSRFAMVKSEQERRSGW